VPEAAFPGNVCHKKFGRERGGRQAFSAELLAGERGELLGVEAEVNVGGATDEAAYGDGSVEDDFAAGDDAGGNAGGRLGVGHPLCQGDEFVATPADRADQVVPAAGGLDHRLQIGLGVGGGVVKLGCAAGQDLRRGLGDQAVADHEVGQHHFGTPAARCMAV
jgi:hypothetical protein